MRSLAARWAFSLVVAAVCVGVLRTSVYTDYEHVRVRMVTTSTLSETPVMAIPLVVHERFTEQPTAITLGVRSGQEPVGLDAELDGQLLHHHGTGRSS